MNNNEDKPLRIIVSGCPGSGKTSLISALAKKGYSVIQEAARQEIINQQAIPNSKFLPWKDIQGFSTKLKNRILANTQPNETAFSDRGMPDVMAYLKLAGIHSLTEYHAAISQIRYYNIVFLAPPWKAIYKTDAQRKESYEDALKLHELLIETYTECGFEVILLPLTSIEQRCQFIIRKCAHLF